MKSPGRIFGLIQSGARIFLSATILSFFISSIVYSQGMQGGLEQDSINENSIVFGVNKIVGTYNFTGDLLYSLETKFGIFRFHQDYSGTAIQARNTSFRDDESFYFDYVYPLYEDFSISASQSWLLFSDNRSVGLNKLERLNGAGGFRYNFLENSYLDVKSGWERNNQIGLVSSGPLIQIEGREYGLTYGEFDIFSRLNAEYVNLIPENASRKLWRENSLVDFFADISRDYDVDNQLDLSGRYKLLGRDFLATLTSEGLDNRSVENRLEKRINADFHAGFRLFGLLTNARFNLSDVTVERSFRQNVEDVPLTGVRRKLHELQLGFTLQSKYISDVFAQSIGISVDIRNEENAINKKFDISRDEEDRLRQRENQRDNSSSRNRLYGNTLWNLGRNDTLALNFSLSLLKYDTPSKLNFDDRDEFNSLTEIRYSHRFSNFLAASFNASLHMNHLVFLKAERSAMNNWSRILKFNPVIYFNSGPFSMAPSFDVLANYTVYDFEDVASGISSFSFRQVSYRDSLNYELSDKFSLESRIILKYYERGVLFWDSFAETPQNSNLEQFAKLLLITREPGEYEIGFGVRYFRLLQEKIQKLPGYADTGLQNLSYGPEAIIRINFGDRSSVIMDGWLELQRTSGGERLVPNFFLRSEIKI